MDLNRSPSFRTVWLHNDKQIDIAIRTSRPAGMRTKQYNSLGMEPLDNPPYHFGNGNLNCAYAPRWLHHPFFDS
jgi:hypothetical protein